jgi:hypothetical protein
MPESFGALPQAERTALDASVRALLQGTVDVVAVDLATTALGGAGTRFEMDQYFRLVPGVKWALARQFAPPRKESGFIVYRRQQPGAN